MPVTRAQFSIAQLRGLKGASDIHKPQKYLWQRKPWQLLQLPELLLG